MSLALDVALLSGRQTSLVVSPDTCVQERAAKLNDAGQPATGPFPASVNMLSTIVELRCAFTRVGRI